MSKREMGRIPPPPKALSFRGVTKQYDDVIAVHDIDLELERGELVAFIGHNGAGKSTLLGMASGLIEPTEGIVLVAGHEAGTRSARAELWYAGDTPLLYEDLSIEEHFEYIATMHGVDDWQTPARALLTAFDLKQRTGDVPARLSRGMRQKAALGAALIRPAAVLLVDEPFVGLDVSSQATLSDMLVDRAHSGTCVVVATHQPAFLDRVDRCVVVRNGEIHYDGKPGPKAMDEISRT